MYAPCRVCGKVMWISEIAFITPMGLADDICGDKCLTVLKNADNETLTKTGEEVCQTKQKNQLQIKQ